VTDVVLFGSSEFRPVWLVLSSLISGTKTKWAGVLRREACKELEYEQIESVAEALRPRLESGEFCSLQVQIREPVSLLIGLYAPRFCGGRWNQWRCIAESSEQAAEEIYQMCKTAPGITFVCVAIEEHPDICEAEITAASFPWGYWRLRKAAVLRSDGRWDERRGPKFGV